MGTLTQQLVYELGYDPDDGVPQVKDVLAAPPAVGEIVRARVKAHSGVTLQWEIIRLGRAAEGRAEGEALAEMVG